MITYASLLSAHAARRSKAGAAKVKRDQAAAAATKAEAAYLRRDRVYRNAASKAHPSESILRPLAAALSAHRPGLTVEVSGPFGIGGEYLMSAKAADMDTRSLTFRYAAEYGLSLVDYTIDTGRFVKGSLGEINGLNYPDAPIPVDADLDWFLTKMRLT